MSTRGSLDRTRRTVLRVAGSAAVLLAGCLGRSDNESGAGLPEEYETATSQAGVERVPDRLQSKRGVNYYEATVAGQRCANCLSYVPAQGDDTLGMCRVVEGRIAPDAWCTPYARYRDRDRGSNGTHEAIDTNEETRNE